MDNLQFSNIARYKNGKQEFLRVTSGRHNFEWCKDISGASKFFGDSLNQYLELALKNSPNYIIQSLRIKA